MTENEMNQHQYISNICKDGRKARGKTNLAAKAEEYGFVLLSKCLELL